ncbi:restriction endonuclease [Arachidicoccus terrestris]|uniref:restriction endonuclease n=1 Tax=Arachidicoccus terrestris TaxID=2875539 RepID=UPI001CC51379|nr:restriction endonuclease [Arachidicoccus terrestris]UAY55698.1 restriction endonuclease [Arachidicoccus terrestris]
MTITTKQPQDWKDLQNRVSDILEQCGFKVEKELTIDTVRGKVELDVYAEELIKSRRYTIVCECKYWKTNVPQNVIHGFRTVVNDLGCNVGYVITTSDFQSGSVAASESTNVELLTWEAFQALFFESWYESYFSPQMAKRLDPILTYSEPILPKWFEKMNEKEKGEYFALKDKYDLFGWIIMDFTPYARFLKKGPIPTLPLLDSVEESKEVIERIPIEILKETGYQEFLEKCCDFGNFAVSEFRQYRDKYYQTGDD